LTLCIENICVEMKNRPVRHRLEYAFYLVLKGGLRALPHSASRRLGRALGWLGYLLDRRHREVALRNMARALPEKSDQERRALVRACFQHFGMALCDTLSSTRFGPRELCARFDLEGWEHLDEAYSRGKGVFVLSAHFGLWESVPPMIGLYHGSLEIVYRPADNPYLDRELRALRERSNNKVIPKRGAVRRMIEVLRERGRVGILIDQRVQPREGIWVPFLGEAALTSPIVARLSLRTGAAVVPVAAFPLPGGRYRLVVRKALLPPEPPPGEAVAGESDEAVVALTRRYLEAAEEDIRAHPALWLWMHRRWESERGEKAATPPAATAP
jgi:KDO2-lipid IV(A) lauroyltransferase